VVGESKRVYCLTRIKERARTVDFSRWVCGGVGLDAVGVANSLSLGFKEKALTDQQNAALFLGTAGSLWGFNTFTAGRSATYTRNRKLKPKLRLPPQGKSEVTLTLGQSLKTAGLNTLNSAANLGVSFGNIDMLMNNVLYQKELKNSGCRILFLFNVRVLQDGILRM